jgi:hypothetical protein
MTKLTPVLSAFWGSRKIPSRLKVISAMVAIKPLKKRFPMAPDDVIQN